LALDEENSDKALRSFAQSCPKILVRNDVSGLTRTSDWAAACDAANDWHGQAASHFFSTYFETMRIADGRAFATGYFEPELAGSRTHLPGYDTPVYALPGDLVSARPGDAPEVKPGQLPLGRYSSAGEFLPYFNRAEIEDGALGGRGLEIAWVRDPVEFFFLQVQGSGRLRLPDGSMMRIGYAGRNGFPYQGIGAIMRDRGLLGDKPGQYPGSMQGIMRYIRKNPTEGRALMRENRSWIFFREVTGDGPYGTLNVPLRAGTSVAVDPGVVPLGAPIWLDLDRDEADGLWIAQDTGGAIKGPNRFDTFWGAGEEARRIAGGMSGRGNALVLVPKGTLERRALH
jgi:membrane-bound lytic murein transglycosylase A